MNPTFVAVLVALLSGLAIAVQSTLTNWADRLVGALNTGLLVNFAGSAVSLVILAVLLGRAGGFPWAVVRASAPHWALAGAMGVGIIAGIAFALPRVGVAAGLAGIILGQMIAAVLIDSSGWAGQRIPLGAPRLVGVALLVAALWLILPRR